MSIHRLKKIAGLMHLSDFTIGDLFTSFGLYQMAVISTKGIKIDDGGSERCVYVSADVQRLNELLCSNARIMLPCAECGQQQPFKPKSWGNPQRLECTTPLPPEYKKAKKKTRIAINPFVDDIQKPYIQNAFEISNPIFRFGSNVLNKWDIGDEEKSKEQKVWNAYLEKCINECKSTIVEFAGEIRKDFFCTYQDHRAFANFRVFNPIEPEDYSEYCELLSSKNEEDIRACEAYKQLCDCVVIQKVGQYPSIADMQLFDIGKYRKVLSKDSFIDFRKAIGLYADGIGCGAFLYLRRIFERLIEKKHQECKAKEGGEWDEEDYVKRSVDKRIELLEEEGYIIIPDEIREVKKKLYGVLSKGVHESTDELCVEVFPYVKFAIEIILEEELQQKNRIEQIKKLPQMLGKVTP